MTEKWYEKKGENADVVVSTRIRLARNLKEYPFPNRLSKEQRYEVAEKIKDTLMNSNSYIANTFDYIDVAKITNRQVTSLVERHLISPSFATDRQGKFLLLTKDESISIMINEEDHLRIQVMGEGLNLKDAYKTADKIDTLLDNTLCFAFHDTLGYLTQCPTNIGTGVRASVMLHLPALKATGAISRIENNLAKIGLVLRGTFGEGTEVKSALYQLSNQVTLGLSEETAIDNLRQVTMQIINQEKTAREELSKRIETRDYIYRSLGTLKWAELISNEEAMQLLSAVRFGVSQGIIKENISLDLINSLLISIQPATLCEYLGKELSPQERDIQRAILIKQKIS